MVHKSPDSRSSITVRNNVLRNSSYLLKNVLKAKDDEHEHEGFIILEKFTSSQIPREGLLWGTMFVEVHCIQWDIYLSHIGTINWDLKEFLHDYWSHVKLTDEKDTAGILAKFSFITS